MLRNNLTLDTTMSGITTKTSKIANKISAVKVNIAASCFWAAKLIISPWSAIKQNQTTSPAH